VRADVEDRINLDDVVERHRPTILLGLTGQPQAFTEKAIRAMAAYTERPIVFPLSNPTDRCVPLSVTHTLCLYVSRLLCCLRDG
jgi:malic enzyme